MPNNGSVNFSSRRVFVATVAAALWIAAQTPTVFGECSTGDPPLGRVVPTEYVFTATVEAVTPTADPQDAEWHVELQLGTAYVGSLPDHISLQGWGSGCSSLRGWQLQVGDQLMVALDDLDLAGNPSLYGPLLIWHRVGDSWTFYSEVLDPQWQYTEAMRSASTTDEILQLTSGNLPDTSTAATTAQDSSPGALLLVIPFVTTLALAMRRTRCLPLFSSSST